MKIIDKASWNRREHFDFFSAYHDPFFCVVSQVECGPAFRKCKDEGISFFAHYLHKAIVAANTIEAFRMRIHAENVVAYEEIHAASTIGRPDGTFAFSFVPFSDDFETFNHELNAEIARVQKSEGLRLSKNSERLDVLHFTALPWYSFTSISHARNHNSGESTPKVGVGKAVKNGHSMTMPVSAHVHHGLMDGYHIGLFMTTFEQLLNEF